ncbi:MAG: response regulator [Candidatus Paceibacterota bacterium]
MEQKKHILLVEDNPNDELLTKMALEKSMPEIEIDVARDGHEAIEYFFGQNNSDHPIPTLIILDLNIPMINGLEVLQRLRSETKTMTIPIVVLTSSKEEKDIQMSFKFGANSYILKPVDFVEFEKIADLIGRYWLNINETVHK